MEKRYISIKEVLNVIWSGRIFTLVCALILTAVALTGGIVYENSVTTVSTIVALEWNGLTAGEYPDGSRFDYHDMFESYVLTSASEGIEVSTEEIRENLSINPVLENDVLAIVQNALENGETISYYASEYTIQIDVGKTGMTVDEGRTFLSALITELRSDFEKKYVQGASVLDFTDTDLSELDYFEIQAVFESQLDVIESEMNTKIAEVGNYEATNYSFNDILVRQELIRTTTYSNLSSKINSNLLTKDLDELLNKLLFQKEEKEYDLAVATAKRDMINDLITNYKGNTSTVIIPGSGDSTDIEIDTYYKELVDMQIASEVEVAKLTGDVLSIETSINRYKGLDLEFVIDEDDQAAALDSVNTMIPLLESRLEDLVADTNEVLVDYNSYLISGNITPLMAPQQERNVSLVIFGGLGFVIGAVVGVSITLYKKEWE